MYQKDFDQWGKVKKQINVKKVPITIRSGDVRWVILGVNVASEIDGKGDLFLRPALILHVIGADLALVVPLTSKQKSIPGYIPFALKKKFCSLCLHQIKVVSQNRILHRLEHVADNRVREVQKHIMVFYGFHV